ncbi:hypothetical protein [Mycobacterium spongiae]|uniref:DUF1801 domain-containing protein n=1 Tax=Mycobacterium spongiae TaxID=886343 RepID=A0A975JWT7_9MYCO|nr:hypothetical protein [Mycobacterium spongiae]QUR67132.1 DUF1801 domain-containing protein [Mycobacterium spongiae]
MRVVDTSPDDYLATLPEEHRATLTALDRTIQRALPGRDRVLWQGVFWGGTHQSIIGYGHVNQTRSSGDTVAWFLVGLARQKRNYSIYVNAAADNAYLAHRYADRLGRVRLGAASISFRRIEDLDVAVLVELVVEADRLTPADPPRS